MTQCQAIDPQLCKLAHLPKDKSNTHSEGSKMSEQRLLQAVYPIQVHYEFPEGCRNTSQTTYCVPEPVRHAVVKSHR